jgi:UDP:flavonoid glycosyltransferase YjiC (YdhE family)
LRILVTTNAAVGHFFPLAPTVAALLAAGHDVRVGCPASFAPTVSAAGFTAMACEERPVTPSLEPPAPPPREDLHGRLEWAITWSWPADARPWAADLLRQARAWRPRVVVVEPVEHAGRVVASALAVPFAEHGWGFTLPAGWAHAGARAIPDLYAEAGARPAPPAFTADVGAGSLQAADADEVARYRYVPWSQTGEPLPAPDGRPRVLVTLGTFDNRHAADRLRIVAGAVDRAGAQAIVVLGNPDRGSAEDFPTGTAVLPWVDMPKAVAACELVIHHGGAGMSWTTLAAGRAAIILPQGGDQFRNAGLLTGAGVGVAVAPSELETAALPRAIEEVLGTALFTERAGLIAAENSGLPDRGRLAADIASLA